MAEKMLSLYEKVSKLIGTLANDGVVTFVDGNNQTRNVKLESLCDKYEKDSNAQIEALNLTASEALKRAIESMVSLKNPQMFGLVLSGFAGFDVKPTVKVEGYNLVPYGTEYNSTVKEIVAGFKFVDGRGKNKGASTEKVITEI